MVSMIDKSDNRNVCELEEAEVEHGCLQLKLLAQKVQNLLELRQHAFAGTAIRLACTRLSDESLRDLELVAQLLPSSWQAKYWARLIEAAEAPNVFSSRDGKLLRRVALELHLDTKELAQHLERVLQSRLHCDSTSLIVQAWRKGKSPGREARALMRSYAYLQAGKYQQALKDARTAAAHGPQTENGSHWPRALAAISAAIEGSQKDNTEAALYMQKALSLQPQCAEYAEDLERLMRRIPLQHSEALQVGGAPALEQLLAQEAEDALPEFRKARPKYYYYYKWMRERVTKHCGELPGPVLEKVIRIDATELDMLLSYPNGIQRQAARLLEVYSAEGPEALEHFRLPLLTYSESQALKAEHAQLAIEDAQGSSSKALPGLETLAEGAEVGEDEDLDAIEEILA